MHNDTTTTDTDPRVAALAAHLDVDADDISEGYQETVLECCGEYLVLTDDEADREAADAIRDSVWAFQAWFIASHCPNGIDEDHIATLRGDSCEDCNDAMVALVEAGNGMDRFIEDAIGADGRGHFLNHYDGNEYEEGDYFIYQTN